MKWGAPLLGREGYPSQSGNNAGGIEDLIKTAKDPKLHELGSYKVWLIMVCN